MRTSWSTLVRTCSTMSSPPWPGSPPPRSTQQQEGREDSQRRAELSPWMKLLTKFLPPSGSLRSRSGDEKLRRGCWQDKTQWDFKLKTTQMTSCWWTTEDTRISSKKRHSYELMCKHVHLSCRNNHVQINYIQKLFFYVPNWSVTSGHLIFMSQRYWLKIQE